MDAQTFFRAIERANASKPGVHTLQPPVSREAIADWETDNGIRLPDDLTALLAISDGVACHQQWYDKMPLFDRGAVRLFALDELQPASIAMYGTEVNDEPFDNWLAIGIGPESALYFVFDMASRHYLAVSPVSPDEAVDLGPTIDGVLEIVNPAAEDWTLPF